jgi:hypothetical protein
MRIGEEVVVIYSMVLFGHSHGLYEEDIRVEVSRVKCVWVILKGSFRMQSTYNVASQMTTADIQTAAVCGSSGT